MSEKNIVYLWAVCELSYETIALQCKLSVDQVKAIIHKPKPNPLAYVPRSRYNGWINGN
jgi:hypothetical protein